MTGSQMRLRNYAETATITRTLEKSMFLGSAIHYLSGRSEPAKSGPKRWWYFLRHWNSIAQMSLNGWLNRALEFLT